jgi:hypothetical protein
MSMLVTCLAVFGGIVLVLGAIALVFFLWMSAEINRGNNIFR